MKGLEFSEFDEDDEVNVLRAVGNKYVAYGGPGVVVCTTVYFFFIFLFRTSNESLTNRLNRVHELTGFSDSVYAEACVTVHQFDLVLDFLLVNSTDKTLQACVCVLS